jgi:hypothetical protein
MRRDKARERRLLDVVAPYVRMPDVGDWSSAKLKPTSNVVAT